MDSNNVNAQSALNAAHRAYAYSGKYDMFIDKADYSCFTGTQVRDLAIVGLTFLLMMAMSCCAIGRHTSHITHDDSHSPHRASMY